MSNNPGNEANPGPQYGSAPQTYQNSRPVDAKQREMQEFIVSTKHIDKKN